MFYRLAETKATLQKATANSQRLHDAAGRSNESRDV
jgi:hypothetical protein